MRILTVALLIAGCSAAEPKDSSLPADSATEDTEESETTADTEDSAPPEGEDTVVTVFEDEHVYFGDEDRRQIDVLVQLPEAGPTYEAITGRFDLDCPEGMVCDHWDRYASFGLVLDAGTEEEQYLELDRFITPYRTGFDWESDLTDLRPLLQGEVVFRIFIDTWVGPGHSDGEGWSFDAALEFSGGPPPSPEPLAVLPIWPHLSWSAGLEDNPVEDQVVPQTLELPPEASTVVLRSFITGHGWNNSQNCAEFCPKWHYYSVGGEEFGREVWRDDCEYTVTDEVQAGTWEYDRAGWCPGAQVHPWDTDVSEMVSGDSVDISYRLQSYEWAGDGDQPYYYMSGVLLVYR